LKKRTKKLLFVGILLIGGHARAQVLAAARQATGGDAWRTIASLHETGTLHSGGRTGAIESWDDVRTGRFTTRDTLPPAGSADGFDGIAPWHRGRSGIAYQLGDVDARLNAQNAAYRTARAYWFADRHDAVIAEEPPRTEGTRHFTVLRIMPEGGRAFTLWIDAATHLIDRTVEQQAEDLVVTRFSDYRPVGGITLPFTMRTGDGGDPSFDDVVTIQHIDINPAIPDTIFALPPRPAPDITLPANAQAVQVPFRLAGNRILVPVSINNHPPLEAEFDSGGSLLLQPTQLARLGLASSGRAKSGGGGEGFAIASFGQAQTVAIGGAVMHDLAFHVENFADDHPDRILVGLETLQRFVIQFDFDRSIMTLTRPDAFTAPSGGTVVPFHVQDNQPEVSGAVDSIAGLFTIDTGDSGSLLLIAPFARRYGLLEKYHATLPYAGRAIAATHGVYGRAGEVVLNGADGRPAVRVTRPVTRISLQHSGFDADRDVSGNIGLGILKQFNLTFDYARQRIILVRNHLYGAPDVFNRAGLRLAPEGDVWRVQIVYPGSPAAQAGIKMGDTVRAVDGQTPRQFAPDALLERFEGPVGARITLSIVANGAEHEVKLTLRELL
jgi:hypothetical protein